MKLLKFSVWYQVEFQKFENISSMKKDRKRINRLKVEASSIVRGANRKKVELAVVP